VKNFTGKILSFLFLFNLLFIQGVNLSEAREIPVSIAQTNDSQKHYCAVEDFYGTLSLLAETDESDNDHKSISKFSRADVILDPAGFLSDYIIFSFSQENHLQAPVSRSTMFSLQGISLMQAYCSFLI
jgi:hypothetical protein